MTRLLPPQAADNLVTMLLLAYHNQCPTDMKDCCLFNTASRQPCCWLLTTTADMTRLLPAYHSQQTTSWQCCFLLTSTSRQYHDNVATCPPQPAYNLTTMLLPAHHNPCTTSRQCCYLLTTTRVQPHDKPVHHN